MFNMFDRYIVVATLWITADIGRCTQLDVSVHHAGSAFFLKPVFDGQEFFTLNKQQKPFIVTTATGAGVFEAKYGPFTARERIEDELLQAALGNHGDKGELGNRLIIDGLDITAHLVSNTLTQERPLLQVLFHASQYKDYNVDNVYKSTDIWHHQDFNLLHSVPSNSSWCMRIYVKNIDEELTGYCILSSVDNVCIAQVQIPLTWWSEKSQILNVYYSVFNSNTNSQCLSQNLNNPRNLQDERQTNADANVGYNYEHHLLGKRRSVSPITLDHGQSTYQELKEDLHVLIYIPQRSFHPGSKLRVPVKLEVRSDLKSFEIRVKAKQGLQVVGAEARNPDRWHIEQEHLQSDRRGAVTATLATQWHSPSNKVESVFDWIFSVEESPRVQLDEDAGRVIFTLSYTRHQGGGGGVSDGGAGSGPSGDDGIRRRVQGKVLISYDDTLAIVPVLKTAELVNTAILTGRPQNHAMHIYAITHTGDISDVTTQTSCHSADDGVLKVAKSCDWVYLDGTESEGSSQVHMIAKFGRHTTSMYLRVWVPEDPLSIELSDNELSRVKDWRIDASEMPQSVRASRAASSDQDDASAADDCTIRFQQSIIEVYARFCVNNGGTKTYLAHKKALFSVTDLVKNSLRVADTSVAMVRGNIVQGLHPGRTEIQVMSQVKGRALRPIAAAELRVTKQPVTVDFLIVDVISGMHVDIMTETQWNRTLAAKIITKAQLTKKDQKGMLDVSVRFSDGKIMPLQYIPTSDYTLDMDTLSHHIITFDSIQSPDTPIITALAEGEGELLKLSLELGATCRRKKSRALVVSYVHVDVTFTPHDENVQGHDTNVGQYGYEGDPGVLDTIEKGMDATRTHNEAQQQPVGTTDEMSALEIGVYVLLGVICVAIVIFAINCVVFVMRYRQKQIPRHKRDSVANANDWVWIGRETLQRNAIQTDCSQALMSEHDFTVNKTVAKFLLPTSNGSSNRSSALSSSQGAGTTENNPPSNRNSVISTYRGSECSIRITPNPLERSTASSASSGAADASNTVPRNAQHKLYTTLPRPPLHTFHGSAAASRRHSATSGRKCATTGPGAGGSQFSSQSVEHQGALSDIQSASAISASSSDDPSTFSSLPSRGSRTRVPTPLQQAKLAQVAQEMAQRGPLQEQHALLAQAAAQIAEHEEDVANGNLTSCDNVSVAWDYEAMGMTYDQLMEYFDNLKESTA